MTCEELWKGGFPDIVRKIIEKINETELKKRPTLPLLKILNWVFSFMDDNGLGGYSPKSDLN